MFDSFRVGVDYRPRGPLLSGRLVSCQVWAGYRTQTDAIHRIHWLGSCRFAVAGNRYLLFIDLRVSSMRLLIASLIIALLLVSCATGQQGQNRPGGPGWYTVKLSDTLYSIAWRYGLDSQQLADWNQMDIGDPI